MSSNSSRTKEWYWGHPEAEPVDSKLYETERIEVSEIIQMHHDHPDIVKAAQSIDEWLKTAYEKKYYLYKWLLDRLWQAGIRGRDVINEASALQLFHYRNPRVFKDEWHYIHVLGNKIIRIIPYSGQTRGFEHKNIGLNVLERLVGVNKNICKAVLYKQKEAKEIKTAMNVPLEI